MASTAAGGAPGATRGGLQSPPIVEEEPRVDVHPPTSLKVTTDLRSVVEKVCQTSDAERSAASYVTYVRVELRQSGMAGNGRVVTSAQDAPSSSRESTAAAVPDVIDPAWQTEANGVVKKLDKDESLDWDKYIKEDNNVLGGFFVCLVSILSLLTIMRARIVMIAWRVLKTMQFLRPNAGDLSNYGCFVVLSLGVTSLQMIDISLIYHVIHGQGTIKLYVVYNLLEIFDKLCQSFGKDVLQVLFNSAEGLSTWSADRVTFELLWFLMDRAIAVLAFVVHSFVLLAQAITLSTCIIAHNNALLLLLVSNNFAEIKSNVFKKVKQG